MISLTGHRTSAAPEAHAENSGDDRGRDDPQTHCAFVLHNDCTLIPPAVRYLEDIVKAHRLCNGTESITVAAALEEALLNALYHGNLEAPSELRERDPDAYRRLVERRRRAPPFANRHLHVAASVCSTIGVFVIRDEGSGFDASCLPDPSCPECLLRESGRGILFMRSFMDEVTFNETGNAVTLVKRLPPQRR